MGEQRTVGVALPLTTAQLGMWYAQELEPDNPSLWAAELVEIQGAVDVALLERALRRAVADTEMFRTRFEVDGDQRVWQVVEPPADWPLPVVDLRGKSNPRTAALSWVSDDLDREHDLRQERCFSFAVLRTGDECLQLYLACHHILLDGWGMALFLPRVAEIYGALDAGVPVPPCRLGTLADGVADDTAYLASPQLERDRAYWAGRLADWPRVTHAGRQPPRPSRDFERASGHLEPEATARLRELARAGRTTLAGLAMAALALYVRRTGRYDGIADAATGRRTDPADPHDDVVLNVILTGRGPRSRRVPGMFANALPLRLDPAGALTVGDLLRHTTERARELVRHQRYPHWYVARELKVAPPHADRQDEWHINVMTYDRQLSFGPHPASLHNLSNGSVAGMCVNVYDRPADGSLRIDLQSDPSVHARDEVAAHHRRFLHLLRLLATVTPEQPLDSLDLLSRSERYRLLALGRGRGHGRAVGGGTRLHRAFERQAAEGPDVPALVCGVERLTRREVEARANRLARHLVRAGAGPERCVAVALPRDAGYVVALLAVFKAGAVCLPLDTGQPAVRNQAMTQDAQPVCALAHAGTAGHVPPEVPLIRMDDPGTADGLAALPDHVLDDRELRGPVRPEDAAYLAFTSGTTGRPKGVVVEHRQLANLYADHEQDLILPAVRRTGRRLRSALTASFCFDTFWVGLLFLAAGQELHLIGDGVRHDPAALAGQVHAERLDFLAVTPSYLRRLLAAGMFVPGRHRPGTVMVGGEAIDPELWRLLRSVPDTVFLNYYGPTEATVDTVWCRLDQQGERPVIGRPVHNVTAYVLDPAGRLVPGQTVGELYLGGAQIARGYLGQPELTGRRFVPDPFGPPGARLYRTGDLVRWTPGGMLQYVGRADDQFKIHGVRIEPREIEAVLAGHPDVGQAAVTVHEGARGARLTAHVVPAPRAAADAVRPAGPAELRAWTAARLPAAMVPSGFAFHDALPLTAQGKLDRAALPAPAEPPAGPRDGERRGPRTGREKELCALFAEALGVTDVGIDDDFFELGGHSLSATQLIAGIRTRLGAGLPDLSGLSLGVLYQASTVAALGELLGQDDGAEAGHDDAENVGPAAPGLPHGRGTADGSGTRQHSGNDKDKDKDKDDDNDHPYGAGTSPVHDSSAAATAPSAMTVPSPLSTSSVLPPANTVSIPRARTVGEDPMMLPLRASGDRPPLFCVHPAGGLGWCYAPLPRHLPADIPVYAVQAYGLRPDDPPATTCDELIEHYVRAVRSVRPTGPYRLLGWSLGGTLAHALAARLQAEGEDIALLAMLDSAPVDRATRLDGPLDERRVRMLLREAVGQDPGAGGAGAALLSDGQVTSLTRVLAGYPEQLRTYTPRRFDGDLLYFRAARERRENAPADMGWRPWIGGDVVRHDIDSTHHTITAPAHLRTIGAILTGYL